MKTDCWGNLKWLKSLCCLCVDFCMTVSFWNSIGLHEFRIDSSRLSQLSGLCKPANALVLWWNFLSEELPYALVDLLAAIVVALTRILILFGFRWIVFLLNREYLLFIFCFLKFSFYWSWQCDVALFWARRGGSVNFETHLDNFR